jgi:hypothetical protein
MKNGKEIPQITAFIVEVDTPGVEVTHRCHFMGLKAIQNAVIRFTDVRVPRENILWGEGKGLKLALITLNTGRLTLPMSAAFGAKAAEVARKWAAERVQWGAPVGKHDAVAQLLGGMAADTFGIESMAELSSALADQARNDIRLEAAIAKLWTTEIGVADRRRPAADPRRPRLRDRRLAAARGEAPIPVERMMRDFRINRIFEGTSEIMRLFIAREAVDTHLQVAGDMIKPDIGPGQKLAPMAKAGAWYAGWLPKRFVGGGQLPGSYSEFGRSRGTCATWSAPRASWRGRCSTPWGSYQAKLERKQALLGPLRGRRRGAVRHERHLRAGALDGEGGERPRGAAHGRRLLPPLADAHPPPLRRGEPQRRRGDLPPRAGRAEGEARLAGGGRHRRRAAGMPASDVRPPPARVAEEGFGRAGGDPGRRGG